MATLPDLQLAVDKAMAEAVAKLREALELARHELTALHGLHASDGAAPAETWRIDTTVALAQIDLALAGAAQVQLPPTPAAEPKHAQSGTASEVTGTSSVAEKIASISGWLQRHHAELGQGDYPGWPSCDCVLCVGIMRLEYLRAGLDGVKLCQFCGHGLAVSAHGDGVCNRTDGAQPR